MYKLSLTNQAIEDMVLFATTEPMILSKITLLFESISKTPFGEIVFHSEYTVDNSNPNTPKIYRKVSKVHSQGSAQSPTGDTYCNSNFTSVVISNYVSLDVSGREGIESLSKV